VDFARECHLGRVAYVLRLDSRPEADEGMAWQKVESFSAGDELPGSKKFSRWRSKRVVLL
jgi:hypothetical protein